MASSAMAQTPARLASRLNSDLDLLIEWLEGEFDNYWQSRIDRESGAELVHQRIHTIFARIELDEIGPHVFYVQQYVDGDPGKVVRQHLYSFRTNLERQAIVATVYSFPAPAAVLDAHLDPAKLAGLREMDLLSVPGCEIYWQRHEEIFEGHMSAGACRVEAPEPDSDWVRSEDLRLTENGLWISRRIETAEKGELVSGEPAGSPYKLRKVRYFECSSAVQPLVEDQEWDVWHGLVLHDQGGVVHLEPAGGGAWRYRFELYQAVYEGASRVPVLELSVFEPGSERSIAYSWSSPDSSRLGINLRFLQVGCTGLEGQAQAFGIKNQSSK